MTDVPYGSPSPSPVPPSSPIAAEKPKGVWGYWLGSIAMVLGVILFIALIAVSVSEAGSAFRFPQIADGTGGVDVTEPGNMVVFVVEPLATSGSYPSIVSSLTVTDPSGSSVVVSSYSGIRSVTGIDPISGASLRAEAVATFTATSAGRYQLQATDLAAGNRLGIGKGTGFDATSIGFGLMGGGLLFLIGLILVILTAVRRRPPRTAWPTAPMAMTPVHGVGYPGTWTTPGPVYPVHGPSGAPSPYPPAVAAPPPIGSAPAPFPPPVPPAPVPPTPAQAWDAPASPGSPPDGLSPPGHFPGPAGFFPSAPSSPTYRDPENEDFAPPGASDH